MSAAKETNNDSTSRRSSRSPGDSLDRSVIAPSTHPRAVEIVQVFDAQANLLTKAALATEYYAIRANELSAQGVQNPRAGRPGLVSMVARELALPGKTDGAKRMWLERALTIASVSPEAITAAKRAQLRVSQSLLLEIAAAGDTNEQFQKITELAQRKSQRKAERKLLKSVVCYPADRKEEVRSLLAKFADEIGIGLLP